MKRERRRQAVKMRQRKEKRDAEGKTATEGKYVVQL